VNAVRPLCAAAFAAVGLLAFVAHASAMLVLQEPASSAKIKNGGFEKPSVPASGYMLFSTGQTFDHWTVVGASGNVAVVSGAFVQNGLAFPAGAGKQWLDLTGNSNTPTGVQQTLKTTPNAKYKLTFLVGSQYDPNGIFGTSSTVDVLVNGTPVFTATNSPPASSSMQIWKKFTTTVTATSATTSIAFINGDPSSDTDNGLDAVKLAPQGLAAMPSDEE
jgi:hypothetical protein